MLMIRASLHLGALKESPSCKKPLTPGFKVMSEGPAEHTAAVLRCQIPLGRLSVESLSRSFPGVKGKRHREHEKRKGEQGVRKRGNTQGGTHRGKGESKEGKEGRRVRP